MSYADIQRSEILVRSAPLIFIVLTLPLPFILRPGHYRYSDVVSGFLAMLESAAARFSRVSP